MPLLTTLLLLLVTSRLLGQLVARMGQPVVVGEILAGILLGPALLNLVVPSESLAAVSDLSAFLVVFSAGLEMEFGDVITALRGRGLIVAILGFALPFGSGVLVGAFFELDPMRTVFLGLCVSITALPVAIRILEEFDLLQSSIAKYSIATAILNDVVALLCLGVILDMPTHGTLSTNSFHILLSVFSTVGTLLLLGTIIFLVYRLFDLGGEKTGYIKKFLDWAIEFFGNEALFGIAVLFVLLFASMSEKLGSHFVIGTFFAALLLSKDLFGASRFTELKSILNSITGGFLAPIFFAYLGLQFKVSAFSEPGFILAVLVASILSKVLAGWMGGKFVGVSNAEAWGIGIICNGRGIMELVVASIALQRHFINEELFSTLVLMGIFTTVLTPVLFRRCILPKLSPLPLKSDGGPNRN